MNLTAFATFPVVFILAFALVRCMAGDVIYSTGLIGGAVSACLAYLTVQYLLRPGHSR